MGPDGPELLRINVVIDRKFFNKASWVSEAWKKEHPEELERNPKEPLKESRLLKNEETV